LSSAKQTIRPAWFGEVEKGSAPAELSAYFLELSSLLDRIESSTSHYQALGLNRSATREHVNDAYQQALSFLYPEYSVGAVLPSEVTARIDNAFRRVSLAFSVLASFANRRGYEPRDLDRIEKPAAAAPASASNRSARLTNSASIAQSQGGEIASEIRIGQQKAQPTAYRESVCAASGDNRRRSERMRLAMPVRANGFDRKTGKWNEMTQTVDVGRTGLTLRMKRRVQLGRVLYLTLPLPAKLRSHCYSEPHYGVYALIRRVEPPRDGARNVSLEFLGEHPPDGFLDKPWAVFRTKKWDGSQRRRGARQKRAEQVRVEYFSDALQLVASEDAETENSSRTGLRITVKAAPAEFDLVRVSCRALGFEALAAPRNRFVAKDGVERLCVKFIEKEWPL